MFGIPYLHIFITVPILVSERPPAFNRVSPCVRLRLVPRSVVPRPAFAERNRDCGAKVRSKIVVLALRAKWAAVLTPAMLAVCTPKTRCFRFYLSPVFLQSHYFLFWPQNRHGRTPPHIHARRERVFCASVHRNSKCITQCARWRF